MRFSSALGLMSRTVIGNAFSTLAAIGLPMFPTPMKPTVTAIASSSAGIDDLVPHLGVLLPVLRPDPLLGDLAERGDVGLIHLHALGLEDLLRFLEVVDRFGHSADLHLRFSPDPDEDLLLVRRQPAPTIQGHT